MMMNTKKFRYYYRSYYRSFFILLISVSIQTLELTYSDSDKILASGGGSSAFSEKKAYDENDNGKQTAKDTQNKYKNVEAKDYIEERMQIFQQFINTDIKKKSCVLISFKNHQANSIITNLVRKYKVKVHQLFFAVGRDTGGIVLHKNENIKNALKRLRIEREKALHYLIANHSDPKRREEVKTQLEKLIASNEVKIYGMEIKAYPSELNKLYQGQKEIIRLIDPLGDIKQRKLPLLPEEQDCIPWLKKGKID